MLAYNDSKCIEQIWAYKNDYMSRFSRGKSSEYIVRKVNPIDRVWVLNPSHSLDKKEEGIKYVKLVPGEDHSNILKELITEIYMALYEELT